MSTLPIQAAPAMRREWFEGGALDLTFRNSPSPHTRISMPEVLGHDHLSIMLGSSDSVEQARGEATINPPSLDSIQPTRMIGSAEDTSSGPSFEALAGQQSDFKSPLPSRRDFRDSSKVATSSNEASMMVDSKTIPFGTEKGQGESISGLQSEATALADCKCQPLYADKGLS